MSADVAAPSSLAPATSARLSRSARLRAVLPPVGVGVLAAASMACLITVDPNVPGRYPVCPTKMLTGLDCPGCGSLRAMHALGVGDLRGAIDHNVLLVLALPVVVVAWVAWLVRAATGRPRPAPPPRWVPRAVLVVVVLFGVLRNTPWGGWLDSGASA